MHHVTLRWGPQVPQDIVRKTLGDELPDFYNIVLERPKDDPTGYDVLFIDAASKARLLPLALWSAPFLVAALSCLLCAQPKEGCKAWAMICRAPLRAA